MPTVHIVICGQLWITVDILGTTNGDHSIASLTLQPSQPCTPLLEQMWITFQAARNVDKSGNAAPSPRLDFLTTGTRNVLFHVKHHRCETRNSYSVQSDPTGRTHTQNHMVNHWCAGIPTWYRQQPRQHTRRHYRIHRFTDL